MPFGLCCHYTKPKMLLLFRVSRFLETVLRPTGLLKLADFLGDKLWVTITIAVLLGAATVTSLLPGNS